MNRSFLCGVLFAALSLCFGPAKSNAEDCNALVLQAIDAMPLGGSYAASKTSLDGLARAITVRGNSLAIDPQQARPSFCSGATYLVFVRVLEQLAAQRALTMDPATMKALVVAGQRDGQGIWGRWNASGPGTARLFSELQLGRNFCEFENARPGDFMKIFWTNEIGKKERGHSVVYLGSKTVGSQEFIQFWSSNLPSGSGDLSGYGKKLVAKSKMARVIFSRLDRPANIAQARNLAGTDSFLASMLTRSAAMEEVRSKCGL
jgi:hypothetical protein